jgi:membrane associated rhomboid family serine protease
MEQKTRTAFAKQPAWNSFAAVGFVGGIMISVLLPSDLLGFPARAWGSTALTCAVLGAVIGAVIGAISDRAGAKPV